MLHAIPNAANMTAAEILDWLTAERRDRKPTEEATWSVARIAAEFDYQTAEGMYAAMTGAGLNALAARFAAVGLDAGDPQWETQVDALALVTPGLASLAPVIRDLGYETRPMWQRLGLDEPPMIEVIEQWKADATQLYSSRQVLLSANMNPDGMGLVVRVLPCDETGKPKPNNGVLPGTITLRPGQATGAAKILYDAVQTAIASYLSAVGG